MQMDTEEECDDEDYFRFDERVTRPISVKEKTIPLKYDRKGICSDCSAIEKLSKKLVSSSYDNKHKRSNINARLDHCSWTSFINESTKSALCLSTIAKNSAQKSSVIANKNGSAPANKSNALLNSPAVARRRRMSDFGLRRNKADEPPVSSFQFFSNYKKYMENYRREKLLALQKHLFEDEIKARFEEMAATLAVRRSFLDDLPETVESVTEPPVIYPHRREEPPERTTLRTDSSVAPTNVQQNESQTKTTASGTNIVHTVTSASSKSSQQINLDLPNANNQSVLSLQEIQLKSVDNGNKRGLMVYSKPMTNGQASALPQSTPASQNNSSKQNSSSTAFKGNTATMNSAQNNNSNGATNGASKNSVAKVFDVSSFILDRDLLKRKMAEQLRSAENANSSSVKPLGKIPNGDNSKLRDASPSPLLIPANGVGKSYGMQNQSMLVTSDNQPVRLLTAGDGEVVSRVRAQLSSMEKQQGYSGDSAATLSQSRQSDSGNQMTDVKYWLLMQNRSNHQTQSGAINNQQQQPNLASIIKQQAAELKALHRLPSSHTPAAGNDSAALSVKVKTFNAAEAIPPPSRPIKTKQFSLTTGGQRVILGTGNNFSVSVFARNDEINGVNNNNASNNGNAANTDAGSSNIAQSSLIITSSNNNNTNQGNTSNSVTSNQQPYVVPQHYLNTVSATDLSTALLTVQHPSVSRLYSASNVRTKDLAISPSMIASSASHVANNMMLSNSTDRRRDFRQLASIINGDATAVGDTVGSSAASIANVIVEALNRRSRNQSHHHHTVSKRPSASKIIRKKSASNLAQSLSVALRLTTPADQRRAVHSSAGGETAMGRSLSTVGLESEDAR